MTLRPLPRSSLDRLVPPLVAAKALVALVPETGDLRWAAAAAWDAARAASHGGRRVALVDLWLDAPLLHEVVGTGRDEGIVDAFEFGVSLTKAAREVGGVYFIPAGSETLHAPELLAQPRWRKLQAGFRSEGALLLLFLSASSLAKLAAVPDGVLVLAPQGFELQAAGGEGVRDALDRGATLLGTVRDGWTPPQSRPAAVLPPTGASRRRRPALLVLGIMLAAAGGWALFARSAEAPQPASRPAPAPTPAPTPPPRALMPAPRPDSAAWTVQLAAYGTLERALAYADRLAAEHGGAFVSPIALDAAGTVWYRVLVGAYATRDSAAAGRASLWHRGLVHRGQGNLLRAPYSFGLDSTADIAGLRRRGVPAVNRSAGGRVLVGAFETPEQAALTGAQLKRAGVHATFLTRTGTRP